MLGLEEASYGDGSGVYNDTTTFDNFTLSCAASSIQGPVVLPYSDILHTIVRIFQSLFWMILLLAGTFLNVLVIVLVAKYRRLQTVSFGLALQIVAQDLVLAMITSSGIVSSIANQWILGEHVCSLVGAVFLIAAMVRTPVMLVFVIDRFLTVFCPFAYPKCQTKVVIILSIIVWLFAFLFGTLGYILDCYSFRARPQICLFSGSCSTKCSILSGFIYGVYATPAAIIPIFLYAILFIKAWKIRKEIALPGNSEKLKADRRATVTFFLLFTTVFALAAPNAIISPTIGFTFRGRKVPAPLYVLSVIAGSVNSLLVISDPILIIWNRDVKEVISLIKMKIKGKFIKENKTETVEIELTVQN